MIYETPKAFIEWATRYDDGDLNVRSKALYEQGLNRLKCPILRLEGDIPVEERINQEVWEIK